MAKNAIASVVPVREVTATAHPPFLADRVRSDAGKGLSKSQDDNIVPLIYLLQALSPQVNPRSPEYLEGAAPGDIWLRNTPNPIVKGDKGLLFQPCHFSKDWVEWVPRVRGGGFVERHADRPHDAEQREVMGDGGPAMRWVRPNGNEVIETRYHVGYAMPEGATPMPFVIPMTSSAHTVSRQWMFAMNSKRIGDQSASSWYCFYLLKSKERSKNNRTWMTWDISDAGWITNEEEYARGAALHEAFAKGEKVVDAPDPTPHVSEEAPF